MGDVQPTGIFTRHHTRAGWRTDTTGGIGIGKFHSLGCQFVDIGCFVILTAITANVGPTKIIDQEKDNVWFFTHQLTTHREGDRRAGQLFDKISSLHTIL
jgi:hypothetical protein